MKKVEGKTDKIGFPLNFYINVNDIIRIKGSVPKDQGWHLRNNCYSK